MDDLDDIEFLYLIHRDLLYGDSRFPEIKEVNLHYSLCRNPTCDNLRCRRITGLMQHLETCTMEYCHLCIPTRWLVVSRQLDKICQTIDSFSLWPNSDLYILKPSKS